MKLLSVVLKQYLGNITRTLLSLLIVVLLASLMLFAIADINLVYENKIKSIKNMPKSHLILDGGVFRGKEEVLKNDYDASFYLPNYMQIGQSINVALVSDNFFAHGIPYQFDVFVSYKNVFDTKVLYGNLNKEDEEGNEIVNPIIIDETTALKRFRKLDAVGRKIILNIKETDVTFTVIAVIKETPVRQNYLNHHRSLNREEIIEDLGYSQAFVFESDINKLTDKKTNFTLAQIVGDNKLKEEQINEILADLEIDYKEKYYLVDSYLLYEKVIRSDYRNSIYSNLVVLGVVFIAFMVIFLINLFHGLRKNRQDISYMKTIGVAQKTQLNIVLLHHLLIILGGLILSVIISIIIIFSIHGSGFIRAINYYIFVLLALLFGLSSLTMLIVYPVAKRFIKNTPNTLFRMDEEI